MTSETKPQPDRWHVPAHLAPYVPHTLYGDRAEELYNSKATPFNNVPVFAMSCETRAQFALLERLHAAGLLRPAPEETP